jgi:hypothetical protein
LKNIKSRLMAKLKIQVLLIILKDWRLTIY